MPQMNAENRNGNSNRRRAQTALRADADGCSAARDSMPQRARTKSTGAADGRRSHYGLPKFYRPSVKSLWLQPLGTL
jgi:hypothetical protein